MASTPPTYSFGRRFGLFLGSFLGFLLRPLLLLPLLLLFLRVEAFLVLFAVDVIVPTVKFLTNHGCVEQKKGFSQGDQPSSLRSVYYCSRTPRSCV